MSHTEWLVNSVGEFDVTVTKALDTGKPVLVYLYGNWEEGTQESWCGDCCDADPIIRKATQDAGAILVEIPVGVRDEYKAKPENPWRVFEKTAVKSIPTLIRWKSDGEAKRLVENECINADNVRSLLE